MQRNRPISETEVLRDLLQAVTRSLPEGWAIREEALVGGSRGRKRGLLAGGASLVAEGTPRAAVPDVFQVRALEADPVYVEALLRRWKMVGPSERVVE